jgi:xanthine/CO dehydrogenase XdhC/CoxF family maturation factor
MNGIAPRPAKSDASRKAGLPCGGEIDLFVEEYVA